MPNGLYQSSVGGADDDTILKAFLRARLPDTSGGRDFFAFL